MNIVLVILRQIVVKYCLHVIDIDTAGSHICCHQNLCLAITEVTHHTVTLLLFHITMQTFCKITAVLKLVCQFIYHVFCITEYKGELRIIDIQKSCQNIQFVFSSDIIVILLNIFHCQLFFYNFDGQRIFLILFCNLHDLFRHRCRKKNGLTIFRKILQYFFDILTESHIQHFICFIQNDRMDKITADSFSS